MRYGSSKHFRSISIIVINSLWQNAGSELAHAAGCGLGEGEGEDREGDGSGGEGGGGCIGRLDTALAPPRSERNMQSLV